MIVISYQLFLFISLFIYSKYLNNIFIRLELFVLHWNHLKRRNLRNRQDTKGQIKWKWIYEIVMVKNSNWQIWRISALASKKRSIKKVKALSYFKKMNKIKLKYKYFFFWCDIVLETRAEILQIFQLLFWRIDDFINSFWPNLIFINFNKTIVE